MATYSFQRGLFIGSLAALGFMLVFAGLNSIAFAADDIKCYGWPKIFYTFKDGLEWTDYMSDPPVVGKFPVHEHFDSGALYSNVFQGLFLSLAIGLVAGVAFGKKNTCNPGAKRGESMDNSADIR
jgi:hypothetical protein